MISQGLSMFLGIAYLKRHAFLFDFKPASFRIARPMAKELARVGIPISFQELMVRISFLYLTAVMNRPRGVSLRQWWASGQKYDVFSMLSATSVANALAALTAQNTGRASPPGPGGLCGMAWPLPWGAAFVFWTWAQWNPESMIRLFSDDPGVIAAGVPYFRACGYDYLMVAFVFCLNGYLNGRSKTLWTMVSCTCGALFLRIPLVWYVGNHFAQDLGMLGTVAPVVSGMMAAYTLLYVLWEGGSGVSLEGTERFSIGEVARMFRVSVSTLRHYEKIGLLAPEYVDPATGYRSYSTRQFECLNTIRYLPSLGDAVGTDPGFSPGPGGGEDPGDAPPAAAGRHPKTPGVGNRATED